MTRRLHGNNARTTLATTINSLSTSITFASSSGFPSIGSGEVFRVTLEQGTKREIIEITDDTSAPTYTCTRAMEGTTAQAFTSGASIELRGTKDSFDRKQDTIATAGDAIDFGAADSFEIPNGSAPTVNAAGEIALDTSVTDYADGYIKYYSGSTVYALIAIPESDLASPTNNYVVTYDAATDKFKLAAGGGGGGGSGDVVGPASATDNAIARFDSTTGKLIQNSVVTIADSTGDMAGVGTLNTHTIPGGTGTLALTSNLPNTFNTIQISGQSDVVADSTSDTLTLVAGSNITLTTNASTDTITIAASGGGGSPGGSDTQVQYNSSGSFAGHSGFTYNGSGTVTLSSTIICSGTGAATLPAGTTAQRPSAVNGMFRYNSSLFRPECVLGGSWTGGQILVDGDFSSTGLMRRTGTGTYDVVATASGIDTFLVTPSSANLRAALTDETGTGAAVFANSPTLVTPALGTAASGNITACSGAVVQTVITTYSTYANTTASIPWDNSIPQNTEGTEYITCSITPTSTTNKLIIETNLQVYINTAGNVAVVALFQDSTANALSARDFAPVGAQGLGPVAFTHVMDAGTTSSTTFKVRAGVTGGTLYIHGNATERKLGGAAISYLKITEIKP